MREIGVVFNLEDIDVSEGSHLVDEIVERHGGEMHSSGCFMQPPYPRDMQGDVPEGNYDACVAELKQAFAERNVSIEID